MRTLREVRVWSPHESHRTAFAREMDRSQDVRITTAESPALAVQGADLIVDRDGVNHCPDRRRRRLRRGAHLRGRRLPPDSSRARRPAGRHSRGCSWIPASAPLPRLATSSSRRPRDSSDRTHIAGELGELLAGRVTGPPDGRGDYAVQVARHGGRGRRGRSSRVFEGAAIGAAAGRSPCEAAADGGAIIST